MVLEMQLKLILKRMKLYQHQLKLQLKGSSKMEES